MKDTIKKYYELDEETKELLYSMSLFHEIETQIEECDNQSINNLGCEEKILEIAMTCSYLTKLDGSEIVRRLLEILNCRDISIDNIIDLTTDELIELISNIDDEYSKETKGFQIIKRFMYDDFDCLFVNDKANNKYFLTYKKDGKISYLTFNSLEEMLSLILDRKDELYDT